MITTRVFTSVRVCVWNNCLRATYDIGTKFPRLSTHHHNSPLHAPICMLFSGVCTRVSALSDAHGPNEYAQVLSKRLCFATTETHGHLAQHKKSQRSTTQDNTTQLNSIDPDGACGSIEVKFFIKKNNNQK